MPRRVLDAAAFSIAVLFLALVVSLPASGFPAGAAGPGVSAAQAERLSRDWKRIRTANFEAVANAPIEDVLRILEELEVFRGDLVTRFLRLRTASPLPTLVVVLKDEGAFERFKPRDERGRREKFVGGYFMPSADMNLIVLPRMTENGTSLRVVFHEYFHYVARRNMPDIPTWLDEGLAEFYSTSEFHLAGGGGVIGKVLPGRLELLRAGPMIPLDQLLSRDGAAKVFRDGEPKRVAMFYAQSWALVHFLMLSDNGTREPQIRAYLAAIERGLPLDQAFGSAFGLTYQEASRLLSTYIARSAFPAMTVIQNPAATSSASSARALTESEAEFVQGDLLVRLGAKDDGAELLRKALELAPSSSQAKVALALVFTAQDRPQEAIELLRPIADAETGNLRAHLALADAFLKMERFEEAVREYSRAAGVNDQTTAPWIGTCVAALALGRVEESDRALAHLQLLEAGPDWYQLRAYEAFRLGDYATAARDARAFVARAGRGAESAPYMAFLAAICYWRLDRDSEADAALTEVAPALAAGCWQARVMAFMQGRLAAEPFLTSAKDIEQRTEAHAYAGFKWLQAGRRDEALSELRWVRERGVATYVEHRMAVAELKRLEKLPPPPR
jgi:tetratricopeptide (TPR) repeat protein